MKPLYHRVLLTGANGLVGQALVERLGPLPEVDLLSTSRDPEPFFTHGDGGFVPLDVTDHDAVRRLFVDFAPSAVIHCAAMSKVHDCEEKRDACWETNVDATSNLARECHGVGARLVLLSTDFVFDGQDGPYAENARPGPINFYGRSKLAAENAVRRAGLRRWTVIRTTLGFGTGENLRRGNFATWLLDHLLAGREALVPADQLRTPTYVPDLADGIARATLSNKSGVYHIAGRELITVQDFALAIARHFDLDEGLVQPTTTLHLHPDAPRPLRAGLLILKAESELGYRPRPLAAALDDLALRMGLAVPNRR